MRLRKDKIIMKEKKVSSSEIDDFGSIHPKNNDLDLTFRGTTIIIRHRHYSIQRGHPQWRHPLGGGESAKRWRYSISLFIKMSDKGVKNLKKIDDIIYGRPLTKDQKYYLWIHINIDSNGFYLDISDRLSRQIIVFDNWLKWLKLKYYKSNSF